MLSCDLQESLVQADASVWRSQYKDRSVAFNCLEKGQDFAIPATFGIHPSILRSRMDYWV
jgi:hypothetical protein